MTLVLVILSTVTAFAGVLLGAHVYRCGLLDRAPVPIPRRPSGEFAPPRLGREG